MQDVSKKKRMKFIVLMLSCLLIMSASCNKAGETEPGKICFTRTNNQLKINNDTGGDIHFTAFGQNILPVINWAPSCGEENTVAAKRSASKELSSLSGYADNDELVVYWWECSCNTAGQVQNVTLNKNEIKCK